MTCQEYTELMRRCPNPADATGAERCAAAKHYRECSSCRDTMDGVLEAGVAKLSPKQKAILTLLVALSLPELEARAARDFADPENRRAYSS